jgi:hypothetical protein
LEAVGATPGFVASASPSTKLLMLLDAFGMLQNVGISSYDHLSTTLCSSLDATGCCNSAHDQELGRQNPRLVHHVTDGRIRP